VTDAPPPKLRTASGGAIEGLLDPGSFFELDGATAARPHDGVVAGVGTVDGRDVAVWALDGGTAFGEAAAAKVVKLQELALRTRIPIVGVDGPGGPGPGIAALGGAAEVLERAVRSSGRVPQLGVWLAGEPGWEAALCDFVFGRGAGAHFPATDEAGCWLAVRRLLSYLPAHCGETPPFVPTDDPIDRADAELQAMAGGRRDGREAAVRVLDDRQLLELRPREAAGMLAGFGRLGGHTVGVVANVGPGAIDGEGATRAARFVRFCDAFNVPLVTLVDTPGFAPDVPAAERARLAYAYAEATVPKLAVVTGAAGGGAYAAMSPKQAGVDLNLAWPGASISAGGPEAAFDVYLAAERGYVDEVIEPRETRRALVRGLEPCLRKTVDRPARKHGNLPL
jgi:propionyl-CoA carboxylase beta chain